MRVNVAVCGKFHYHNYLKYIDKSGILNQFFYSHRMSTNSASLSVPKKKLVNIWIKEYLLRMHLLVFNYRGSDQLFPFYHDLWEILALLRWNRCDILHIMLHGTGRKLIRRARTENSLVIGEPVNSHPEILNAILSEEYERLGIRKKLNLSRAQGRLIQELGMCDYLLVASNFMRSTFIEKGFTPEKIYSIPYGVDLSRFCPLSKDEKLGSDSLFRVICVAQITPRKGASLSPRSLEKTQAA